MYRLCVDELCEEEIVGKLKVPGVSDEDEEEVDIKDSIEIMNYKR